MSDYKNIPNPCYVLDEQKFISNMEKMKYVQDASGAKILCALKGFAMWSTFPIMKKYLAGCTASSLYESKLCYEEMGVDSHACAVIYQEDEINDYIKYNSHLTFNSISQWEGLKGKIVKNKKKVKCALRINPEYSDVGVAIYNPCMLGSRLGITAEQMPKHLPKGITGLHFHALCESNSDSLERVMEAVEEKFGHLLHEAEWVNFGGGHHITRDDYDTELLIELIKNFKKNYNVEVFLEPGEAIGWKTGFLLARVEDLVEANNEKTVVMNVSFTCHMPDCLEMPYKPALRGESEAKKPKYVYTFGGPTCLSGDFIKGFGFDKPVKKGDTLIFEDMMHYTFVKTTMFNGVNHPAIGILKKNGKFKLVRKFGYSDYKGRMS